MTRKKNMNILVTGGAGFLGSNLCRSLLLDGHNVTSIDNFDSGKKENLKPFKVNSKFTSIEHDIRNPLDISEKFEEIYHLACPASPKFYQKNPIATTETCVIGTINVLKKAVKDKATILFTSTSEVYGDPEVHPQPESYKASVNFTGIRSCYDEGKRCAESLFYDFRRTYGIRIKVARLFNTYGPNMRPDDGRVVSNFICQSIEDKPLTIYGDGTQTRSFCFVDDLILGLRALMSSSDEVYEPINLGNPTEFSLLELVEEISKITNRKLSIEHKPLPLDDPKIRRPDISKAKKELNWSPSINLQEGLKKTYSYFLSRHKKGVFE